MNIRVYIFQHNKTIDYFDTSSRKITEEIKENCDKLMNWAIEAGRAERGYYEIQVVEMGNLFVLDSEDVIV